MAEQTGKSLEQMTDAELGKLFPIILVEPDPRWIYNFRLEKERIVNGLGTEHILQMDHIGSTAIPGIKAKPTIDILVQVPETIRDEFLIERLQQTGYHYIPRPDNPAPHMMFVKGYTDKGFEGQACHIHVRHKGDWDEVRFRDYLIAHPQEAKVYEELKVRLSRMYKNDREGYTEAKTEYIRKVNDKAKFRR